MPIKPKSVKAPAWRAMRAAAPSALLVTLVFFLLTSVLDTAVSLLAPPMTLESLIYDRSSAVWVSLFLTVLMGIYRLVMDFGYNGWSLRTARMREAGYGHLMDGFGMVGRVLLMELMISLRIFLWSMALVTIYTALMTPVLLLAGPSASMLTTSALMLYLFMLYISLRYSLAPFLLYDYPEAGANRAIRRSVEMTRGHIWDLIRLHLSFWPWYLAQAAIILFVSVLILAPAMGNLNALIAAGQLDTAALQADAAMNGPAATILSTLFALPLTLFFHPYLHISLANFYRTLSHETVAENPGESNF